MLPIYVMCVDISERECSDQEKFQEQVAPCLGYLDALRGAFGSKPYAEKYYPPSESEKGWSVRYVLMISVGKKRAEYLLKLYQAIARLIEVELPPELDVRVEISGFEFS